MIKPNATVFIKLLQDDCFHTDRYTGISLPVCLSVYKILVILCHKLLQFCTATVLKFIRYQYIYNVLKLCKTVFNHLLSMVRESSPHKVRKCLRLIEWCFTPLSTVSKSYHGDSSHYSCLSWVSPGLGWGSEVSCTRTLPQKTQRIQCGSNPGPLDYESNTLPLSHAGPLKMFVNQLISVSYIVLPYCFTNSTYSFAAIVFKFFRYVEPRQGDSVMSVSDS